MTSSFDKLVFLKLGGSLITDKASAHSAHPEILARLADEIAAALHKDPELRLVLGHGSGSFGHFAAKKFGTYDGVHTPLEWRGFAEVWKEARALNELVMDALVKVGLPVMAFPASATTVTSRRAVLRCEIETLQKALGHGLIPVIQGDVVFDTILGGSILSTEDQFFYLAARLEPQRILLAGIEAGVWSDFPTCTQLFDVIHLSDYTNIKAKLSASAAVDVTGGMAHKVERMLDVIRANPTLEIRIFSGVEPQAVERTLLGAGSGTLLTA